MTGEDSHFAVYEVQYTVNILPEESIICWTIKTIWTTIYISKLFFICLEDNGQYYM